MRRALFGGDAANDDAGRAASLPFHAAWLSLAIGFVLRFFTEYGDGGTALWWVGLFVSGVPVVFATFVGALRGKFAADLIASLAVVTAAALGQPAVGLIVVVMQTGGEALERHARLRASAATRALEAAAPRIAHRLEGGGITDIAAEEIIVGDALLVRPGELLPCNAEVVDGRSHVDVSPLTGEPVPVTATTGTRLGSGTVNGEGALTIRALAIASESEYARIVDLVRTAQRAKAPIQRLADRYAVWFTPLTLVLAVGAAWSSGDLTRALAVLVVATPCPLILATPVAVIGGINRAARRGIVVRHGTALEKLGELDVLVLDKTGTITIGHPAVDEIVGAPPFSSAEVLRLAGSVEQASSHVLARSIVTAAQQRTIPLSLPERVEESPGRGVMGIVDGREVAVGSRGFVNGLRQGVAELLDELDGHGSRLRAYVTVNRYPAGVVEFADALRDDWTRMSADVDDLGVRRVMLLSGDSDASTAAAAAAAKIADHRGNLSAADKAAIVASLVKSGDNVVMVGDGINDAPALATATVGVALAARRGGATAAAADVVILADDLGRFTEAIRISRRTLRIARQGIRIGLAVSGTGMLFAALGMLPPLAGAAFQEVLDLVVIFNALRTVRG